MTGLKSHAEVLDDQGLKDLLCSLEKIAKKAGK